MSKKKSKLQQAQDEAQAAINETNKKIEELGKHSNNLCIELNNIQKLFDEIRNIPSDKKIAEKLQIDEGDFVYHIIRNRSVDGKPYCVEITYIPLYRLVNLKADVLKDSLYKYVINQLHLTVQSCHLKITSALSTILEQSFLGLGEGEPYIQEEQTTYLSNGSVFELTFNRRHYADFEFQTVIVEQ